MNLRSQLQKIYDKHGKLDPQVVLEEARNKKHALHSRFQWDNNLAAEAYRLDQAHRLIRSVRQTFISDKDGSEKSLRAFHALRMPGATNNGYSYEPTDKIVSDPFLSEILSRDMQREWMTLRRRWEDFQEFWELIKRDIAA